MQMMVFHISPIANIWEKKIARLVSAPTFPRCIAFFHSIFTVEMHLVVQKCASWSNRVLLSNTIADNTSTLSYAYFSPGPQLLSWCSTVTVQVLNFSVAAGVTFKQCQLTSFVIEQLVSLGQ